MNSKQLRRRLKLNRTEWARILGVTERTVYRWEAGTGRATGTAGAVLVAIRSALLEHRVPIEKIRLALEDGIAALVLWALREKYGQ